MLKTIKLKNFLSFGPDAQEIELKALNVLIGPNASGKSNLLESIAFLRAAPRDLTQPIRDGGGVMEWLFKGGHDSPVAEIEVSVNYPAEAASLRHAISFSMTGQRFELQDESVVADSGAGKNTSKGISYYNYNHGESALSVYTPPNGGTPDSPDKPPRILRLDKNLKHDQSVLSQRQGPEYPEISYLGDQYSTIKLYREWDLGRYAPPRIPQKTDLPDDYLEENAGNLALVLNTLAQIPGFRGLLIDKLQQFHDAFCDFSTRVHGGTIQLFLQEKNLKHAIPATRVSDGTLRFLCLLSVLCHPNPPPLICIEEPEIGLHPDSLPMIAELLVEASRHTQIIASTHSDILVDALSSTPESILICEKTNGASVMNRLSARELKPWLEKYRLGELWTRGNLGGTRW